MTTFFTIAIAALLVAGCGYLVTHRITLREGLMQVGVVVVVSGGFALGVTQCALTSVETHSGVVTGKKKERVSCSHSYQCNCVESCSGSGVSRSCTEICQTCYDHSYDIDWAVYTTDGGRLTIDREDRQGLKMPGRFSYTVIGEPSASRHSYKNYLHAANQSLFNVSGSGDRYSKIMPEYPQKLYDYYRMNRVVSIGVNINTAMYENAVSRINASLGKKKQVNIILVLVNSLERDFLYALDEHWKGGNKNDAVVVMSLRNQDNGKHLVEWADTIALVRDKDFNVAIRSDISGIEVDLSTPSEIIGLIGSIVEDKYERKPMAEFEYLMASIRPPLSTMIGLAMITMLLSGGLSYYFWKHDVA